MRFVCLIAGWTCGTACAGTEPHRRQPQQKRTCCVRGGLVGAVIPEQVFEHSVELLETQLPARPRSASASSAPCKRADTRVSAHAGC
eukprot:1460896-Rhodomonas_salina.1